MLRRHSSPPPPVNAPKPNSSFRRNRVVARKKKQNSNIFGWAILAVIAFGIYQFGFVGQPERSPASAARPASVVSKPASQQTAVPLSAPRYVNVAELNVRHLPNTSGPLIMTLPRGTPLRALDRQTGWPLIDINPTLGA